MTIGHRFQFLSAGADIVLVLAALVMVGFYVSDRTKGSSSAASIREAPENWRDEIPKGIVVGARNPKLTIIEFMDFEFPFCARWASRVDSLLDEHPHDVQLVVHHFPIQSHANAIPAAVAIECAHEQERYLDFQRALFSDRGSLGVKPWAEYAADAGVPNIDRFRTCAGMPADSFPRIAYGVELGKRTGVRGTPTVWVNGVVRKATLDEMRRMITEVRD
jgi:protein-disulfide isomerase